MEEKTNDVDLIDEIYGEHFVPSNVPTVALHSEEDSDEKEILECTSAPQGHEVQKSAQKQQSHLWDISKDSTTLKSNARGSIRAKKSPQAFRETFTSAPISSLLASSTRRNALN